MKTKTTSELETNKPLKFIKKSKYFEKIDKFNFNIEKIKAEFLTIFYQIKKFKNFYLKILNDIYIYPLLLIL